MARNPSGQTNYSAAHTSFGVDAQDTTITRRGLNNANQLVQSNVGFTPYTVDASDAPIASHNADGFVLDTCAITAIGASRCASLLIKLPAATSSSKVDKFQRVTTAAPVTQQVTGIGFTPTFVMALGRGVSLDDRPQLL